MTGTGRTWAATLAFAAACIVTAMPVVPQARAADARKRMPVTCSVDARKIFTPEREAVDAQRRFELPVLRYATGERPAGVGIAVHVYVDATGKVTCADLVEGFGRDRPAVAAPQREAALQSILAGRYEAFVDEGRPVEADFIERIAEEDIPAVHRAAPDVPLSDVRIRLERTPCFGSCPIYTIEVDGQGVVTYEGEAWVDVAGKHRDRIPPERVAQLVERAKQADFWSLRERYAAHTTDFPSTKVTIVMGNASHAVEDYLGEADGMPHAMSELEAAIEEAVESAKWVHLTSATVDALENERFAFDSREGAQLLMRAIANEDTHDDAAIARLVERGAPIGPFDRAQSEWGELFATPMEAALTHRRGAVVEALLARGALGTPERPDAARRDGAFRAAIAGGELAAVQRIWNFSATRPSLGFDSQFEPGTEGERPTTKRAPVTLLLDDRNLAWKPWEGFAIARWLAEQGCDLLASDVTGRTLLHVAAREEDLPMTRWLLASGADPNARTVAGDTPLDEANDEDVALALLDAGAKDPGADFVHWAREFGWTRVQARLGLPSNP